MNRIQTIINKLNMTLPIIIMIIVIRERSRRLRHENGGNPGP